MGFNEDLEVSARYNMLLRLKGRMVRHMRGYLQAHYVPIASSYLRLRFAQQLARLGMLWTEFIEENIESGDFYELYGERNDTYLVHRDDYAHLDVVERATMNEDIILKKIRKARKNKLRLQYEKEQSE